MTTFLQLYGNKVSCTYFYQEFVEFYLNFNIIQHNLY